jgi:outer membrane protein OmpA-like peptidoglycan-associated protein
MATETLLDSLRGLLTPQAVSGFAATTGEPTPAVSRALTAAFPAILGGLLQKSGDQATMRQVMSLLTDRSNDPSVLSNAGGLQSAGQRSTLMELGERLLALVLGDRQNAVARTLAETFGIKSSSASSLLGIAAPMVLAVLGDRVRKDGLDASGLARLLAGERDSIVSAAPAGLTSLLGLNTLRGLGSTTVSGAQDARRWLWPALIGALALAGLWALLQRRDLNDTARRAERATSDVAGQVGQAARDAGQATADAGRAAASAAAGATAGIGAFVSRRLPSNVDLNVPERGVESQVIVFITDPARPLEPATWFNFDRLTFETGSAKLRPESREQLRNVAEILKAYPTVKVKIGGYTDNTGDPTANVTLSQARATNVMNEIIAFGVPVGRITAEGYGAQFPVADNSTEAGRAQNRRIALRVTQK